MEFRDGPVEVQYVGDVSGPWGLDPLKVDGLALVTELDGTGSDPPASSQRDYLVEEIETHHIDNIPQLLADVDNSIASIRGFIPAGARKGDRFDVEVECTFPNSKTTSLRGGYLMQARMKPMLVLKRSVQMGHNTALARGRVLVDRLFESHSDGTNELSGVVLGGGIVTRDRNVGLRITEKDKSVKTARSISRAINARFSTRNASGPVGVANPTTDRDIEIEIPDVYRHNVGRYFHVILNIAFDETAENRVNRLEWLERQLHDPDRAKIASIRLEAMGQEASAALKRGLRSEDPLVRFHSAQALAYMGDDSGVSELHAAIEGDPAYRWHGLTALASIRNKTSEKTLSELMSSDSATTRYGAFQTIRDSLPGSPYATGELIRREFMLHEVDSDGAPMIHFSRTKLQEIVLFGRDQRFNHRLMFIETGLTIKAIDDSTVQIKLYVPRRGEEIVTCSTRVADVIRHLAAMGFDYGDMLSMLKDAKRSEALDTNLIINAAPRLDSRHHQSTESISGGGQMKTIASETEESSDLGSDSQSTLYTSSETPDRKAGFFDRMKSWWSP